MHQCDVVTAVGDAEAGQTSAPWIVQWNGATWTSAGAELVTQAGLDGVSCVTASCQAVGADGGVPLQFSSTNGTWTSVRTPILPPDSSPWAVIATATSCVAVGVQNDEVRSTQFAEYYDGTSWSTMTLPAIPGSAGEALEAVSCAGPT